MSVTLAMKSVAYDTYAVSGKNLKDVAKSIDKKGPVDPNDKKRVAFLTTTELDCLVTSGKYVTDGKAKVDKKTGWFEVTKKVSTLKLVLSPTVKCPKRSMSGLSARALVEWYRFYAAALIHEAKHVDKAKKESEKIGKELNNLRGKGVGETEAEAAKMAEEELKRVINIYFFDERERLNVLHRKFDRSTKHGEKNGALLDKSIE